MQSIPNLTIQTLRSSYDITVLNWIKQLGQDRAIAIMEKYGIDIAKETTRRRQRGTLTPLQFLTFVDENTPQLTGANMLPNIIGYDHVRVMRHLREQQQRV